MIHRWPLNLDEWTRTLMAHLPRGMAWRDPDGRMARLLRGAAPEFQRFHEAALDVFASVNRNEMADPILAEWEDVCALPDANLPTPSTVEDRRTVALGRITRSHWAQTVGAYIALAALNGCTVEIDNPEGFTSTFRVLGVASVARCGTARVGDRLGTVTESGRKVMRSFLARKRAHARIIWR